ncbi:MAG: SH3 domain-containing protein [Treponema sp.]|jgi:hypothetical protein|nr:SH3 domain-containing protein [Treponema sp.]
MSKVDLKCAVLTAVFCAALVVSCGKSTREQPLNGEFFEGEDITTVQTDNPQGVVLIRASLWELQNGNQVKWVRYVNAGETVEWKGESQKLINTSDNKEYDYYRVHAGGDYWIRDYAVKGPAIPGVVLAEGAMLYSQPDLGLPLMSGTNTIHQYTIVAVDPEVVVDPKTSTRFFKTNAYYIADGKYYVVNNRYVKEENISTDPNDVRGMSLYQLAMATENLLAKRELLNNALAVSGRYHELVQRELVELDYADRIETMDARDFVVIEDDLSVYDRPDETGSQVEYVEYGQTVTATARTKEPVNLYGITDYWYKIQEPKGWIFGAWVSDPLE